MRGVVWQANVGDGRRSAAIVALAIALGASGCSSIDGLFDSSPAAQASTEGSSPFRERINALFGSPVKTAEATPAATPAPAPQNMECPSVDIRSGASTLSIGAPDAEPNPTTVRY